MRRFCLAYLTIFNASAADMVTAAAAASFDSVGVRIAGRKPDDRSQDVIGNQQAIAEIRRRLRDTGMRLAQVSAYKITPAITMEHMLPVIETCAELGCGTILMNGEDPDSSRRAAFIAAFCEAAGQSGIRIGLEFAPYSEVKTIGHAHALLKQLAKPNLGLVIDALHLARSGGTPTDIVGIAQELIYSVQLCDAPREKPAGMDFPTEARTGRLNPGEGDLPLYALLDTLDPNIQIDCEAPRAEYEHLPPIEQARRAGDACRRFLETYQLSRESAGKLQA